MIDFPYYVEFYFQNGDMEPKYGRVANCDWYMVRWPRIEHKAYVSHPQLFAPSSHIPYLCLRRIDNSEAPHIDFHLNSTT